MRKVGMMVMWLCLGLGISELAVLSMEQVVVFARMPQQMMAYTAPSPLLTRTDPALQTLRRP